MFFPPVFSARPAGALRAALAAALLIHAAFGRAADEQPDAGTFTTPGTTRTTPSTVPRPPGAPATFPGRDAAGRPTTSDPMQGVRPPVTNRGTGNLADVPLPRRPDLPPPRPSEFQRFVEGATGRLLPVFGADFFAEAGETFLSLDNVPVSADYTIGPGDEVLIRAWGSIDVDYRSTVDRNGMINLPKVGSFNVAGVKAADLERNLRGQIGRLFTNFDLSVSLGQLRGLRVFIVGPAQRPGVVTLASQSTLLSAVVTAGGPSPSGSMRKILLRRDGKVISELDVYDFLVQGDKSKDIQLAAGDVVVFQPVGPRVALTGALDTPAIYELKSAQEPLRDLLRYAGGAPVLANPNRVQLERIDPTQPLAPRFVETFRLDAAGQQKAMRDGDVLTLLPISPQFANAVTLTGNVAQPLRFPYTPGMRIRDLIPDRDALITPDFYRRKNMLVQVIEDDEATLRRGRLSPGMGPGIGSGVGSGGGTGVSNGVDDTATGRSQRPQTLGTDRAGQATPLGAQDPATAAVPGSAADRANRAEDRALVARQRRSPAVLFEELNWDYATIERLNPDLSTQVIGFNLGKAVLQGDEANNVALAPGDVVTVYSQKDVRVPVARQTRLVSVSGEIGSPGVYQLQPGETLKSLLQRAGGFTPQAYVYGLEFSREETRVRQRENLAAAIARLETLAAVQTAREAANRRDDVNAQSSAAVSNAATQAQLTRLSRLQPNGRIALELTPDVMTVEALPDLPLEHGDQIVVPPRPGFVTVAGAVVNSNAFIWKPGRTAGDYLKLAGADEAADTSNMFILRADGTVSHANDSRGFFGRSSLESQPMQPGDALIVPNQLDFETWGRAFVRNLKDWSQIFAQFGLGIAAINSIKNN
jgi:protein involved in polysaccharide export with SLBB domain